MHFVKVRVPFLMHLYLPWQRVHVQLFTPHVQGTGRTEGAGVRGLQPRSNSSKTSRFLSPLPFPLLFLCASSLWLNTYGKEHDLCTLLLLASLSWLSWRGWRIWCAGRWQAVSMGPCCHLKGIWLPGRGFWGVSFPRGVAEGLWEGYVRILCYFQCAF